ncbi:IS66 family transposase zinc-finger binding domain-containing protein [Bradyrhizobium sp. Ai1a-2]|uniref:IS66 family transposase zinc-finger binding domain-containing protein n=1 Tax=Bradyrhizobium sp. Ai1a-2 TaxID=196490 RepID=UPI0013626501|nr:IS66 family transposase zinc-finger binding domain-containing protein [Bradyrhizobium sp. Ai1a-2]
MATLQRLIHGPHSERLSTMVAEQLALDLADLAAVPAPANDDTATPGSSKPRSRKKRNIGSLPKHLPRCDVVIEPETTICPCCARELHRIGEAVSETLDRIPAVLRILRTIRLKWLPRV